MLLMESNSLESQNGSVSNSSANEDYTLAIVAECLYLINLLFFPGLAFMVLSLVYFKYKHHPSAVVRCHLKQTFVASLWAGVMIVFVSLTIVFIGGLDEPGTWLVGVLYFLSIHAALVFMGAFGLARAINNQHYHYHIIGPSCELDNSSPKLVRVLNNECSEK